MIKDNIRCTRVLTKHFYVAVKVNECIPAIPVLIMETALPGIVLNKRGHMLYSPTTAKKFKIFLISDFADL